jgi:hypothetical protein
MEAAGEAEQPKKGKRGGKAREEAPVAEAAE